MKPCDCTTQEGEPLCCWCHERIAPPDLYSLTLDGQTLHEECLLRQVIGSVAHLQHQCGCFQRGSTAGDPAGLTKRQAAQAALCLWRQQQVRP